MLRRNFMSRLIGGVAGLCGVNRATTPSFAAHAWPAADSSPEYQVKAKGITVELSAKGEIVRVIADGRKINVSGRTSLAGCTQTDAGKVETLSGGAIQFTRTLRHSALGRTPHGGGSPQTGRRKRALGDRESYLMASRGRPRSVRNWTMPPTHRRDFGRRGPIPFGQQVPIPISRPANGAIRWYCSP